jgi:N-acetylglutamate synthase-like GNAT family acetyltransferase
VAQQQEIRVRRAKVSDADEIVAFYNHAWGGRVPIDRLAVLERFGSVGFLLAERDGRLMGFLGWQAENLVVRVTDLLIWPASEGFAVSRVLLAAMEQAADELVCEAVLLFLRTPDSSAWIEFYEMLGYEPKPITDLPRAWQEAAREACPGDGGTMLMKQLRDRRVIRPL